MKIKLGELVKLPEKEIREFDNAYEEGELDGYNIAINQISNIEVEVDTLALSNIFPCNHHPVQMCNCYKKWEHFDITSIIKVVK